jgi:hypothetical protein
LELVITRSALFRWLIIPPKLNQFVLSKKVWIIGSTIMLNGHPKNRIALFIKAM